MTAATFDRLVTLIQLPREIRSGAARQRAHQALGFRSQAAENWLRDHGVSDETCDLPMLRMPAHAGAHHAVGRRQHRLLAL